jgi:protein gp37
MNETAINWTKHTWNPVSGCTPVSEGCKYCYARTLAERMRGTPAFPNGFDLTVRPHKLNEPAQLKQPSMIFVNSMSDLFWEQVPDTYRHQVVNVIEGNPQHTFQVLTKRPELMLEFSRQRKLPPNFWAGVTVESARTLPRLDVLRRVKADVRFVSIEPLLTRLPRKQLNLSGIQWVIVGGESGTHLRDPEICEKRGLAMNVFGKWVPRPSRKVWVREIQEACIRYKALFWLKQWGGKKPHSAGCELDGQIWQEKPGFGVVTPEPQLVQARLLA